MSGYMTEFSRRGNFIWFYSFAYDTYELQHVSIGTLCSVSSEYLLDYRQDGSTVEDALWNLVSEILFEYFASQDGVGQRCLIKRAFDM